MSDWLARILRFVALLLVAASAAAAQIAVPALTGRITDTTGTLTREQVGELDQRLAAFEARKGVQLAVLMVPTTGSEAIEQYSLRVAEQWKLGRSKVDDGALLVIAKVDRKLRIEVGYGLEGALTDLTTSRIINESISRRFGQGDFAGGIAAGLERIMSVVDGEPLPPPSRAAPTGIEAVSPFLPVLVVLAVVSAALLRGWMGRIPAALVTGTLVGAAAWTLAGAPAAGLLTAAAAVFFSLAGGPRLLSALGHGRRGRGGRGGRTFRGGGGGSTGRW